MPSSSTPNAKGCRLRISSLLGAVPCSIESGDNFAIIDPVEGSEIHRRLPVFGRDDDSGAVEESSAPDGAHHLAEGWSTKSSALVKTGPGSSTIGEITACCAPRQVTVRPGSRQLLACRNCLVHPQRSPAALGHRSMMTIDQVDDSLNLVAVVLLSEKVVRRPVGLVGSLGAVALALLLISGVKYSSTPSPDGPDRAR
jgi:hypothetical protein